ncbi:Bin/amphiphysin/Rvs domain for vesicular trafficking-domain-containing protein, partial [Syncephalastrum racemosum]
MMADQTDNIRVVDAEPQQTQHEDPHGLNANAFLNNTLDGFANLSSKFNPFAQKLNKGIGQVRQYAQERLGTAEDITELPQEYKDLEKRIDTLRSVYNNMLKVTRIYNNPSYDYPVQLQESLAGITNTFTSQFQQLALSPAERAQAEHQQQQQQQQEKQQPRTLSHALSRVSEQSSQAVGLEEPLGTALFKLATVTQKVGDARINMDAAIVSKFNQPMQTTLNTAIEQAMRARRNVQSARLSLDACKAKHRSVRADREDAARLEVEQAEDHFVAAVEEATGLMKAALENPEPFRNLADLVAAQVAYYKEAHEILSELAPELDEMQVTQESLYRNNNSH